MRCSNSCVRRRRSAGADSGLDSLRHLAALLLGHNQFRRSILAAASLFAVVSILAALSHAVLGTYAIGAQFSPPITDFVTAFCFAMVTIATVGYGDIHPATSAAMLFVVSVIAIGITLRRRSWAAHCSRWH